MNVLVINCGSSSLKYQLINSDSEEVLAKGLCERIGIDGRLVYQKEGMDKEITEAPMPTHKEAIQMVLDALHNPKSGAVKDLSEIDAVGHRVVHGGEKFAASVVLNEEVLAKVEECNDLAEILIGNDNIAGFHILYKIFINIFHAVRCKFLWIRGIQISCRNNYVCINVVTIFKNATMCCFHISLLSHPVRKFYL